MPEPKKLCAAAARKREMLKCAGFEVVPELVKEEWGIELGE